MHSVVSCLCSDDIESDHICGKCIGRRICVYRCG